MTKKKLATMSIAMLIPLLVGGLSALITSDSMNIYETLQRPFLAPPGWLFPVVWTLLYVMMGLASYYVYVSDAEKNVKWSALGFYIAQLIMNFFWSIFFFTCSMYMFSLIWLLIMWVLIIICVVKFYRIKKIAGILMGVLFLWTTFAAYLNLTYVIYSA